MRRLVRRYPLLLCPCLCALAGVVWLSARTATADGPLPFPDDALEAPQAKPAKRVEPPVEQELPADAAPAKRFGEVDRNAVGRLGEFDQSVVGARTASLSVDWVAPESILVGEEGRYELVVRNRGHVTVEGLVVEDVLPAGFEYVASKPEPEQTDDGELVWKVARLAPQEESRISLRLVARRVGSARSRARVNFSTSSIATFRVVEPKLDLIVEADETVVLGDKVAFHLHFENPGSGKTTNARVRIELPEALAGKENVTTYEVGDLEPGERRSVRVLVEAQNRGLHDCRFTATADHDLQDEEAEKVKVIGADLALSIDGPSFRYVTRPATYTLKLKNVGDAKAEAVRLRAAVPEAFAFVRGDESGRFDERTKYVNWTVGDLEPGKEYTGRFVLRAEDRGKFPILSEAVAERGLGARADHETKVDGIAAILLEVVDVDDPVEVGAQTTYEILVTNQGTEFARNVAITVEAPEAMTIVDAKGPTGGRLDGRTLTFETLPKLAPRADAIYRVKVTSAKPGDQRIEVEARADSLAAPVTELESTKVYADQ